MPSARKKDADTDFHQIGFSHPVHGISGTAMAITASHMAHVITIFHQIMFQIREREHRIRWNGRIAGNPATERKPQTPIRRSAPLQIRTMPPLLADSCHPPRKTDGARHPILAVFQQ